MSGIPVGLVSSALENPGSCPPSVLCRLFQFLLLLGCFAFFWSLYYTLEVTLGHVELRFLSCLCERWGGRRGRRGHRSREVEESLLEEESREEEEHDSGVELQGVVDSETKESISSGERHEG